jgi:hypothetical protein
MWLQTHCINVIKMGADPTIKDANGKTPRYFVADGTNLDKILHIAETLHPIMGHSLTKLPMYAESMVTRSDKVQQGVHGLDWQ